MTSIDPCRKLVIELRYKPDLSFYDRMNNVAGTLSNHFPDWERSPLTVEVRNKKKHQRIFLAYSRCFFEMDLINSVISSDCDAALDSLRKVLIGLQINELARVGVRQWFAADLEKTFALMVDELENRFVLKSPALSAILTDETEDLAYVIDCKTTDGWKYHLRLGPMTRDEWFRRVSYEANLFEPSVDASIGTFEHYRATFPDNFLYLDLDCFKENVPANELNGLVKAFHRHNSELVKKLVLYCGGKY